MKRKIIEQEQKTYLKRVDKNAFEFVELSFVEFDDNLELRNIEKDKELRKKKAKF